MQNRRYQNHKKKPLKVRRKIKNAAHVFRAFLVEGLGAAVLVFLFLTTRMTPEQLEQYSLQSFFHQHEETETIENRPRNELDNPVSPPPSISSPSYVFDQHSPLVVDIDRRFVTAEFDKADLPKPTLSTLHPSFPENNQQLSSTTSTRQPQRFLRVPKINW